MQKMLSETAILFIAIISVLFALQDQPAWIKATVTLALCAIFVVVAVRNDLKA